MTFEASVMKRAYVYWVRACVHACVLACVTVVFAEDK